MEETTQPVFEQWLKDEWAPTDFTPLFRDQLEAAFNAGRASVDHEQSALPGLVSLTAHAYNLLLQVAQSALALADHADSGYLDRQAKISDVSLRRLDDALRAYIHLAGIPQPLHSEKETAPCTSPTP